MCELDAEMPYFGIQPAELTGSTRPELQPRICDRGLALG
jgi:hypothetical protein